MSYLYIILSNTLKMFFHNLSSNHVLNLLIPTRSNLSHMKIMNEKPYIITFLGQYFWYLAEQNFKNYKIGFIKC